MSKGKSKPDEFKGLRAQAEARLKKKVAKLQEESGGDPNKLIHELQVHQIELEMQNEELRRIQRQLEESREQYSQLFDLAPVGYFILDKKGFVAEANLTGATLLGIEKRNLLKKPLSRYVDKDDGDDFYLHLQKVFGDGERAECEVRLAQKDNAQIYVQLRSEPVKDEKGVVTQCRTAVTNITARKRAEQRLAADLDALTRMHDLSTRILEKEELEPLLQEIMDTAVAIVNADKGTLQLLEGQTLHIVAHHGHQKPFLQFFEAAEHKASVCGEAMKAGRRVVVEDMERSPLFAGTASLKVLREAGVRAVQSTPLLCRKGKLLGVLTTHWAAPYTPGEHDLWRLDLLVRQASDLIESARAKETLHESEERLRLAIQAADMGVFEWDPLADRAVWGNARMAEILGQGPNDVPFSRAQMVNQVVHPDDVPIFEEALAKALEPGQTYHSILRIRRQDDGAVRWIETTGRFDRAADGSPLRLVAVIQDITDRTAAEEALHQSEEHLRQINQELERSNADLQQFAYVASHDLREPLRAITGFMDLLRRRCKDTLDAKANEYVDYAASGAKRMDDLLTGLLAYSRVQTQGKPPAPVSAQAAFDAAVENLRADIDESNAAVSSDPLPSVNVDGMQFTQLLQNLLHNALKFRTDGRPEIHVGCTKQENGWLFCVRDNGAGIEPQFRERIFTIFHRINPQDKRSGYGVGLSICKRIVERHGGRIWVESEPGRGATFYFTVPD